MRKRGRSRVANKGEEKRNRKAEERGEGEKIVKKKISRGKKKDK